VKSYVDNPGRLEKFQKTFAKTTATPEHKMKCSKAAKKLWNTPELRQKVTESVRQNWQNLEYRERITCASKTKWQDPVYREKLAAVKAQQSGQISSIQKMLYSFLDDLNITYYKESEQTRIGFYVFDCLIVSGSKKILIECQGDYWHSLAKAERNDKSKFTYISRYFPEYEIMYVWEHEFYCKDRVLDRLKLKLSIGVETKKFNFKDLTIREINSAETKTFLDLYHYLGKDRGGKAFGAFDNDLLIATIVFSPPLRQNTAGQFDLIDAEVRELSRLCIHPSYHKKNFASWFIKRALKQIDCKLVVAYADTTVGHNGGIYKASNFKLHHTVPADYWYVDKQGYIMHKRTLYGKAIEMKMIEAEYAESKGYIRKYGGEKLCFVYNQK
jgi:GNAT superfamily N-acetyltransferase